MTRIVFLGDFLLEQNVDVEFSDLEKLLCDADLVIGNFEGVLRGGRPPAKKAGPTVQQCDEAVDAFKNMGITAFTLCNNHAYDFGYQARNDTIQILSEAGIDFIESGTILTSFESDGRETKIFVACESHPVDLGNGLRDPLPEYMRLFSDEFLEGIVAAKQDGFRVIAIVHAGLELVRVPLSNIRCRYLELVAAGADAVIGHHPHVPQGFEFINGRPIFYSLGNFLFCRNGMAAPSMNGMAVQLDLDDVGLEVTTFEISAGASPNIMSVRKSDFSVLNAMLSDRPSYELMIEEACTLHGRILQASLPVLRERPLKEWVRLGINLVLRPKWWLERRALIRNLTNENESYIGLSEEVTVRGKLKL